MPEWEYKVVALTSPGHLKQQITLNEQAIGGWELVTVTNSDEWEEMFAMAYFKRPKKVRVNTPQS